MLPFWNWIFQICPFQHCPSSDVPCAEFSFYSFPFSDMSFSDIPFQKCPFSRFGHFQNCPFLFFFVFRFLLPRIALFQFQPFHNRPFSDLSVSEIVLFQIAGGSVSVARLVMLCSNIIYAIHHTNHFGFKWQRKSHPCFSTHKSTKTCFSTHKYFIINEENTVLCSNTALVSSI